MFLRDRVRDGEAEPRALANVLRREERIENPRLRFRRHARPIIGDANDDPIGFLIQLRSDDEPPATVGGQHRLFGVRQLHGSRCYRLQDFA